MRKLLIISFILINAIAFAQQLPILSQYYYNGFLTNPAMSGSEDANYVSAVFRRQWSVVKNGAPTTGAILYNRYFDEKNFGIGGYGMFDKVGQVSNTSVMLSGAYHIKFTDEFDELRRLSLGFNVGMSMLRLDGRDLLLDNPDDPTISLSSKTNYLPDAGVGALYYTRNFFAGFSVPQIIGLTTSYKDIVSNTTKINRQRHYYAMLGGKINLDDELDYQLEPRAWFRYVYGAPWNLNVTARLRMFDLFWVGVGYETSKQIMFDVGVDLQRQFRVAYAFSRHLNYLGPHLGSSHEISLTYIFGGTRDPYEYD